MEKFHVYLFVLRNRKFEDIKNESYYNKPIEFLKQLEYEHKRREQLYTELSKMIIKIKFEFNFEIVNKKKFVIMII